MEYAGLAKLNSAARSKSRTNRAIGRDNARFQRGRQNMPFDGSPVHSSSHVRDPHHLLSFASRFTSEPGKILTSRSHSVYPANLTTTLKFPPASRNTAGVELTKVPSNKTSAPGGSDVILTGTSADAFRSTEVNFPCCKVAVNPAYVNHR